MIESGEIPVILSSVKGSRLPCLATLAGSASFAPATVRRYGKTVTVHAAVIQCLWHGVFAARAVQVVLIRDRAQDGYDLALATTDLAASPAHLIERYASRWSIEMVFPQLAKCAKVAVASPARMVWQNASIPPATAASSSRCPAAASSWRCWASSVAWRRSRSWRLRSSSARAMTSAR